MARLSVLCAVLILSGCTPRVVKEYVTVEVVREVYVPVPADLTDGHTVLEGPVSACPDIARQRAAELAKCNADKQAIRNLQGGAAPPKSAGQ